LQADQFAPGGCRPRFGQFGLADAGRAFGQHRLAQPLGQKQHGGNIVGGEILLFEQAVGYFRNGLEHHIAFRNQANSST
jgi:hypothetical protein